MRTRYNKELIVNFADRLGYKLEVVGINNRVYLIKENIRHFCNGYNKAYQYLYNKQRRIKKQVS